MIKGNKGDIFPLVSVLCPTYNAEKFIEKTLMSIISQDYENIEIIISDDGSTDRTVEIVERISKIHKEKFKVNINETNLGITKNCNLALKMCVGEYVALFAGDDLMYSGKISNQVKMMEENQDITLSYHSVDVIDGDSQELLFTTEPEKQKYLSYFDIIKHGGLVGVCLVMIRRSAIPVYGFSNKFPIVSDWLMLIEVALRGKVVKLDGVYGAYLRHAKGASRKTYETLQEIVDTLDFLKDRYSYSREIVSASNIALNRYLIGEISRLFIAGDAIRLKNLIKKYLNHSAAIRFFTYSLFCLIKINAHHLGITKKIYSYIALKSKH